MRFGHRIRAFELCLHYRVVAQKGGLAARRLGIIVLRYCFNRVQQR